MLHEMAVKIAETLVANGAEEKKKAILAYGAECTLSELITNGIVLILALILHIVPQAILWLVVFTLLRINIGGYHENTHLKCTITSTLLCIGESYAAQYVSIPFWLELVLLPVMILLTVLLAPVIHPNHPVSEGRRKKIRRLAIWIVSIESVLLVILRFFSVDTSLRTTWMFAMLTAVVFAVVGRLQHGRI